MRYVHDSLACPKCGNDYLTRRRRSWWMRLLGIDMHLRCEYCGRRVLYRQSNTD